MDYLSTDIKQYLEEILQLLSQHAETEELAISLKQMNLPMQMRQQFTLAFIGQMKSGKSTLLNAVIGDDKAPVGINECTATVNRFLYSDDVYLRKCFRVYWNNGDTQDEPINQIGSWIGSGSNVDDTLRLDFYSNSPFLNQVNVIDTPGLRSVLNNHEQTTLKALGIVGNNKKMDQVDEASRVQTGIADAILYVINPIGRSNDQAVLDLFGESSSLSGISTFNSIAVVQKWEQMWQKIDEDFEKETANQCTLLKQQLADRVVDVIPVSGLLARCLDWIPDTLWQQLIDLGQSPRLAIEELVFGEPFFLEDEIANANLNVLQRQQFYYQLANELTKYINEVSAKATCWTIVSFYLKLIHKEKIKNLITLKRRSRQLSGIDHLMTIVEKNFFQRAAIIKAGSILGKVWSLCEIGIARLDLLRNSRQEKLQDGNKLKELLLYKSKVDVELIPLLSYLDANQEAIADNLKTINTNKQRLYHILSIIKAYFRGYEIDMIGIKLLEEENLGLTKEEKRTLATLFGMYGLSPGDRFNIKAFSTNDYIKVISLAEENLRIWTLKELSSIGATSMICKLAIERIRKLLNDLEKIAS